jgi:hypothetical protein
VSKSTQSEKVTIFDPREGVEILVNALDRGKAERKVSE